MNEMKQNFPIEFILSNKNDEIFLPVLDYMTSNVKYGYFISNYGRIYSIITNRILMPTIANNGYYINTLRTIYNKGITVYPHRLMMLAFRYFDGCEDFHIDHLNCNKLDNRLENLEWVTLQENTRRAVLNNLLKTGENASWTKVSDNKVHEICKKYLNNESLSKIARDLNCGMDSVFRVVHGIGRINVSSQYDIESVYRGYFSDKDIHKICGILQDNKGKTYNECISKIKQSFPYKIGRFAENIIRNIYRHDPYCYYDISSQYDY